MQIPLSGIPLSRLQIPINIIALQHHELLAVPDDQRVLGRVGGMAEGEEVDGIEHIGLARPVLSDEAVDVWREVKTGLSNVLVVED